MSRLHLREPNSDDEAVVREAHRQMLDEGFTFAMGLEDDESWSQYLDRLNFYRHGRQGQWVPSAFLFGEVDGRMVGRASVRFELDSLLAHEGGHVGYGVVSSERRKGYATEILMKSLEILRSAGVPRILVTCGADNVGSAKVIERCGGVYERDVEASDGLSVRRFWIE